MEQNPVELVLTDVRMPDMDGIELLQEIKSRDPWVTVVIMTAYATIDVAVNAIRQGAYDFVQKPSPPDEINRVLQKGLERSNLIKENICSRTSSPAYRIWIHFLPAAPVCIRF